MPTWTAFAVSQLLEDASGRIWSITNSRRSWKKTSTRSVAAKRTTSISQRSSISATKSPGLKKQLEHKVDTIDARDIQPHPDRHARRPANRSMCVSAAMDRSSNKVKKERDAANPRRDVTPDELSAREMPTSCSPKPRMPKSQSAPAPKQAKPVYLKARTLWAVRSTG